MGDGVAEGKVWKESLYRTGPSRLLPVALSFNPRGCIGGSCSLLMPCMSRYLKADKYRRAKVGRLGVCFQGLLYEYSCCCSHQSARARLNHGLGDVPPSSSAKYPSTDEDSRYSTSPVAVASSQRPARNPSTQNPEPSSCLFISPSHPWLWYFSTRLN